MATDWHLRTEYDYAFHRIRVSIVAADAPHFDEQGNIVCGEVAFEVGSVPGQAQFAPEGSTRNVDSMGIEAFALCRILRAVVSAADNSVDTTQS
ncbi:MAG TPA: hypothetical protein VME44_23700 [Streptosporangiaceae bacterium]|nr:hypothetical protein [Streptosporangiaceae bacterium]